MEVTQIFIYPVKSLRGVSVAEASITKYGFRYDRCYILLKEVNTTSDVENNRHESMLVGAIPEMALFTTAIQFPGEKGEGEVIVTFNPPNAEKRSLVLPLQPATVELDRVDVNLHGSCASAYNMGSKYNQWFSDCFGYAVKLAAVGEQERDILFPGFQSQEPSTSWLSGITRNLPLLGSLVGSDKPRIKFQDCAPFLVVTEKSCQAVSDQLPDGEEFDIRKTRPNIVVSGQQAWEEDLWSEIAIGEGEKEVKVQLQHNCLRCQSLNVDFATGKYGDSKRGQVLKLLQKDRRVDTLKKYHAVFGRYGFITMNSIGKDVRVGDVMNVTERSSQYSGFDWPGL